MKTILEYCVLALVLGANLPCKSDERVAIGFSESDFSDFLSRSTVDVRTTERNIRFQEYHYELIRGQAIDGGCRYTGSVKSDVWDDAKSVVSIEMAHDLSVCERLFIIGIPENGKMETEK